jgi:hypothetical protein
MNSRRDWVGTLRNGWLANTLLGLALALFAVLSIVEVREMLAR